MVAVAIVVVGVVDVVVVVLVVSQCPLVSICKWIFISWPTRVSCVSVMWPRFD